MAEVVVRAPVELDATTSPDLREAVVLLMAMGASQVVVDLSATTFIDSTGVGALVAVAKRARDLEVDLRLRGVQTIVLTTLQVSGVTKVLPVEPVGS